MSELIKAVRCKLCEDIIYHNFSDDFTYCECKFHAYAYTNGYPTILYDSPNNWEYIATTEEILTKHKKSLQKLL